MASQAMNYSTLVGGEPTAASGIVGEATRWMAQKLAEQSAWSIFFTLLIAAVTYDQCEFAN